jgi:hypothetical protein
MVDPEDYDMLKMVLEFMDGTLIKKVKKLNGELN